MSTAKSGIHSDPQEVAYASEIPAKDSARIQPKMGNHPALMALGIFLYFHHTTPAARSGGRGGEVATKLVINGPKTHEKKFSHIMGLW